MVWKKIGRMEEDSWQFIRWWNDSPRLSAAFGLNDLLNVPEYNMAYSDANYTCSKELFAGYLFNTVTSLLLLLRLRSVYIYICWYWSKQNCSIPSWCLWWSGFLLSSDPGTLGKSGSETDASCFTSNQLQQTNNFSRSDDLHTGCAAPDIVHGTADRPPIGSTTRRSDGASSGVCIVSLRDPLGNVCVVPASKRRRVASLDASARTVRVMFGHSSRQCALLSCVRALSGFGKELQGVSRLRASPRISTHN